MRNLNKDAAFDPEGVKDIGKKICLGLMAAGAGWIATADTFESFVFASIMLVGGAIGGFLFAAVKRK